MTKFDLLFAALKESPQLHERSSSFYKYCAEDTRDLVKNAFCKEGECSHEFGPLGLLDFPYVKMGAVDTLDLFGLDELIIFTFYMANKERYKKTIDIGANLGLHSIVMSKCGFEVNAFEPDPWHFELATKNIINNNAKNINLNREAVSIVDGEANFVRVLGNTTGSHLSGSKNSYGEKEEFKVVIKSALPLFENADFAKIDAEGHEKEILSVTTSDLMNNLDIMVEIGNQENAEYVFNHFKSIGVNLFPQKLGWNKAQEISDIPTSHREGSLFISKKENMPW